MGLFICKHMPPQATTSAQAMQNLQNFTGSMKTPDQLLQGEEQNLGTQAAQQQVSGLQTAINNTNNLLNNVAPSVMGRTGNSLVTSAQANAQIQNAQAPLSQQLNNEENNFNTANSNYQGLMGQAENLANANETAQQDQLGYLSNIYQSLYGQEQNQAAQQAQTAQEAEQQREFNASLAEQQREANLSASTSGVASPSLGGLTLGGIGGNTRNGPSMTQRNGGGFNFTSASGAPISAATYAQQTGTPLGTVLKQMAAKGDTYAANAYADYAAVLKGGNQNAINNVKKNFSAIFWGT